MMHIITHALLISMHSKRFVSSIYYNTKLPENVLTGSEYAVTFGTPIPTR